MTIHFNDFVKPILDTVQNHPFAGQLITFLVAFIESLPIIGTVFPGSITMTAIGTMIGTGVLPGFETVAFASLGAFVGDCIGFWLGKHYNDRLISMWPFKKYTHWLSRGETFFNKHGGKSIIIGRFFGPVRSTVPLMAGLLKFTWPRFIIAVIPSAILWALVYMLPGILLGALAVELPPAKMTEFVLTGLFIIFILWFVVWLIEKSFRTLVYVMNYLIDRTWNWLQRHHTSSFLIKIIRNQQDHHDHHQLTLVLFGFLTLILFILLAFCVKTHASWIVSINQPVFYFLQSLRVAILNAFFTGVTLFGSPLVMGILAIGICLLFLWKKKYREFTHFFIAWIAVVVICGALKHFIHSPRPLGFSVTDATSSFPSGHTLSTMVVAGLIAFFATMSLPTKKWHGFIYFCAAIFTLFVAIARIYLGAHWLTDVVGSLLLGTTILFLAIMSYRRHSYSDDYSSSMSWKIWISALLVAWIIPGLVYASLRYEKLRYAYTPYSIQLNISTEAWWNNPFEYLPVFRNNRFGKPVLPFNLQWAGTLAQIQASLIKSGWKDSNPIKSVKTALQQLANPKPELHMPLFASLYLNRPPALLLIKYIPHPHAVIELRLWESNIHFINNSFPLWIGTVNFRLAPHHLLTRRKESPIVFAPFDIMQIMQTDLKGIQTKILVIDHNLPSKIKPLQWNGEILLVRNFQ